jgi:G2/mitotic-specific cyclin-B, other
VLQEVQKVVAAVSSSAASIPGVATVADSKEEEVECAAAAPAPRRSSRTRRSLESSDENNVNVGNVTEGKQKTAAAQSKKRKSSEALDATEPAVSVIEGNVSVILPQPNAEAGKADIEKEAPEAKKLCASKSRSSSYLPDQTQAQAQTKTQTQTQTQQSLGNIPLIRTIPKRILHPAKCSDIIERLYQNYYESEGVFTARPYINEQKDINAKMRAILVDWIVEVHYKFKLHQSTLWLSVNIIDRYLENVQTVRSDLQLVGVASLFIACKFEEVYPPEIKDCVYITDYAYSREQLLGMEFKILKQLDYNICVPTGFHFMTRYLNSFEVSEQVKYLSFYYAERNLQEYDMLSIPPNKFAAFALYAALSFHLPDDYDPRDPMVARDNVWTPELAALTGYSKNDLIVGASNILKHVKEETVTASRRQLIAAKKKYASERYNSISTLPVPEIHVPVTLAPVVSSSADADAIPNCNDTGAVQPDSVSTIGGGSF